MPGYGAFWIGPLLRSLIVQYGEVETSDVQIPAPGAFPVFQKNTGGIGKVEHALGTCSPRGIFCAWQWMVEGIQGVTENKGEIAEDHPVGQGAARCGNCGSQMGNAPFRVGHQSFAFTPTGSGKQEVRIGGSFGAQKTVLQDDETGFFESALHLCLVRHGQYRVSAGDPDSLNLPAFQRLE